MNMVLNIFTYMLYLLDGWHRNTSKLSKLHIWFVYKYSIWSLIWASIPDRYPLIQYKKISDIWYLEFCYYVIRGATGNLCKGLELILLLFFLLYSQRCKIWYICYSYQNTFTSKSMYWTNVWVLSLLLAFQHPGACLYTQTEGILSCDGSHQHIKRLCPCARGSIFLQVFLSSHLIADQFPFYSFILGRARGCICASISLVTISSNFLLVLQCGRTKGKKIWNK